MLERVDPAARAGDVVHVYDRAGQYFGQGFFNPASQIALRMLTYETEPIDAQFWRRKFAEAVALRSMLDLPASTDAYRLVHAEGDGLSGLIAERYADCVVFELFSLGMYQRVGELSRFLGEALGTPSCLDRPDRAASGWRFVIRVDDEVERREGFRLTPADLRRAGGSDEPPATSVIVREHGVRYRVDLQYGHKTGFFCDQRDNRRRLSTLCRDACVLDLCCYSGGFGLCAKLLGRAREVTSVDLDESAIALARENANLNQTRIEHVQADLFPYLRQMIANRRTFDVVVLDPPKLALSRGGLAEALAKYYDMNVLALQVVRPGGLLLTCSCSGLVSRPDFLDCVQRAARRGDRRLQLLEYAGAAADHPVALDCPETAYLKGLWLRVS